jgi:Kef-type K+ transport system membrane component KefB
MAKRFEASSHASVDQVAAVVVGLLLSAYITEWIGIHSIFGAFVFGALVPGDSQLAKKLARQLADIVSVLFLPIFFAQIGMRSDLSLLDNAADWLACAGIIVVACVGKIGGSAVAARCSGTSWREAARVGVLMNTRGLMELVVLSLGLELQVISQRLFTWMTVMTVFTTVMTVPALRWLERRGTHVLDIEQLRTDGQRIDSELAHCQNGHRPVSD